MRSPRSAVRLATTSYVLGMATQTALVFFLVPVYAAAHGVADAQMLAYGVHALAATAVGIPAGRLADRVPRRRVIRFGWGLQAVGALALAWLPTPVTALVLSTALVGAGLSYGFVGFQSYLADLLHEQGIARAYGSTGAVAVLGAAVAPVVAGRVLSAAGDVAAAFFVALLALLGLLLTLPLRAVARWERLPHPGVRMGFAAAAVFAFDPRGNWRRAPGRAAPYLAAYAVLGLGYGLIVPWMGPFLLERHALTPEGLGTLVGVATATGALGIYLAGLAGERARGVLGLALATNGACALSLVAFAAAPGLLLASGLFVIRHFFGNPTGSILNAGIARDAPARERALALGASNLAWNLPWAVGAFLGGIGRHAWGGWLFAAGGLLLVAGPLVGLALQHHGEGGFWRARARSGST